MTSKDIWQLPLEQRLPAFIQRWLQLDEHTGCRTDQERQEMAEIADAIMGRLIAEHLENTRPRGQIEYEQFEFKPDDPLAEIKEKGKDGWVLSYMRGAVVPVPGGLVDAQGNPQVKPVVVAIMMREKR